VTLQIYALDDHKDVRVEIPALDGTIETTFEIKRQGNLIHIHREGPAKPWRVVPVGMDVLDSMRDVEVEDGLTVIPVHPDVHDLKILLKDPPNAPDG
jgi:hypothetical protein